MESKHRFSKVDITQSLINMRLVIFNLSWEMNQYINEKGNYNNIGIKHVLFDTKTDEEITLVYFNKERETFARKYIEDLVENGVAQYRLADGSIRVYATIRRLL